MSVSILVRKYTGHQRFKPHYNTAMGRWVGTKQEYLSTMKAMNLEPYNPSGVKHFTPKPYIPSDWSKNMIASATRLQNGGVKVSSGWLDELSNKSGGFRKPPEHLPTDQGGFEDATGSGK